MAAYGLERRDESVKIGFGGQVCPDDNSILDNRHIGGDDQDCRQFMRSPDSRPLRSLIPTWCALAEWPARWLTREFYAFPISCDGALCSRRRDHFA
jgi:hypothetical protein